MKGGENGRGRFVPRASRPRACSSSSSPGSTPIGGCRRSGDPLVEGRNRPDSSLDRPGRPLAGNLGTGLPQGSARPSGIRAFPTSAGSENPVDRFVARHSRRAKVEWPSVPDRVFARRASLDLVGLMPSPETALRTSRTTPGPIGISSIAEALLADRNAYADHWLTFWNDALRNSYRGTGFIDGGRATITRSGSIGHSMTIVPYDKFVHELISADARLGGRGVHQGDRLARGGQRQPGPAGPGGPECDTGFPRHQPQVRELPR